MKKHPEATALDKFLRTDEGGRLLDGKAYGEYLRNRICAAFSAGWKAATERLTEPEDDEK